MSTAVTYDGVESARGGNIFKDVRFWVALRVPMRNLILGLIKNNGGTVVMREKDADMLIADHARKDVPAGSYSWKFVTESVEHGIIQLKDRYRCGPDPELPRPVGAGGVMKGTRTPFNSTDDASLAKWVLSHPQQRSGNKIFQEYEKINPRHTWQSWRDRFVKHLRQLSMEKLEQIAASAPEERTVIPEEPTEPDPEPETGHPTNIAQHQIVEDRQRSEPTRSAQLAQHADPVISTEHENEEQNLFVQDETEQEQNVEDAPRSQPPESSPIPESEASQETDTAKQEFYDDLVEFMKANEVDIKLRPKIKGNFVELWDLAQAVQAQQVDSQEIDWRQVAVDLGFLSQDRDTLTHLSDCYYGNLVDFLEAMQSFEQSLEGEDEIIVGGIEQEPGTTHPSTHPGISRSTPEYVPSSPPIGALTKRPLPPDLTSPGPSSKRQRYDRNAEIPSTPDEKIGVIRPLISTQNLSPSFRRNLLPHEYIYDSEASQHLPVLPEAMMEEDQAPEEQETEDGQPSRLDTEQSYDITPSQQLHREVNPSPIPFNLNKGQQSKKTTPIGRSQPSKPARETKSSVSAVIQTTTLRNTPANRPKPPRRSMPLLSQTPLRKIPGALPPRQTPLGESNRRDINDWIASYEAAGFPHNIVIEGLKRTTLTPGNLATLVMQSLKDGKEVPTHHEGIWTDRDDADLNLASSIDIDEASTNLEDERLRRKAKRASDRLVHKHGQGRVELRKAYLEAQNVGASGSAGR